MICSMQALNKFHPKYIEEIWNIVLRWDKWYYENVFEHIFIHDRPECTHHIMREHWGSKKKATAHDVALGAYFVDESTTCFGL